MSAPQPAPSAPTSRPGIDAKKARAAFARYRVMAYVTGVWLLLLTAELILKYVFEAGGVDAAGEPLPVIGRWVAFAHGWIYVVYLVTVFDVWSRMRWGFGRIVVMIAAGVVPVLSFVVEVRAARWVDVDLA